MKFKRSRVIRLALGAALLPIALTSVVQTSAQATDPNDTIGVSKTSIQLATLISNSGPGAGLLSGLGYGSSAYVAYINSMGGIYGRKLVMTTFDDAFSPTTAQTHCARIIPSYFLITGGQSLGDTGCIAAVKSSGIPYVQYGLNPQWPTLPNYFGPGAGPYGMYPNVEAQMLHKNFPNVTKVADFYENTPSNAATNAEAVAAIESTGVQVVLKQPIDKKAADFTNYVIQAQNSGAQAVYYGVSGLGTEASLALAMAQQNYHPAYVEALSTYSASWHKLAGAGAAGWTAVINYLPYLNPKAMKASTGGRQFLKWMAIANPGKPIDYFAASAWTSTAMAVAGLRAAGAHPTRTNFMAAMKTLQDFDAAGFTAAIPSPGSFSHCRILMSSTKTDYVQLDPQKSGTFDCDIPTKDIDVKAVLGLG